MGQGAVAKKIAKTALDRIENAENGITQLYTAVAQSLQAVEDRLQRSEELLAAMMSILGTAEVQLAVNTRREVMAERELVRVQAELATALEKGEVVEADKVSEASLIVGVEVDTAGTPVGYVGGRQQILVDKIIPAIREQLIGKGAGHSVDTPKNGKFTIERIYDVVKVPEAQADHPGITETYNPSFSNANNSTNV